MKYTDLSYQSRVLNRLADRAFRHGGLESMRTALDAATAHIWAALEAYYRGVNHV